ncbi:hypothetical protein B0H14DRAFT_2767121 [Mycena olivaceomarginata]|nr:hypothetical protein B0H14DRAFT_2767121 [Mycena olivaceomarginata]
MTVINTTTQLCDILCNLEPDPETGLVGTPSNLDHEHPTLPDGDPVSEAEAYIDVSDDVDWTVEIDVHRHAEPAMDPAPVHSLDESNLPMTEAADFALPALPPSWTKQEGGKLYFLSFFLCIYVDLTDIAMKLFTQTPSGDASRRWFQKIAMSLPKKTSNQVSEFHQYCSQNHLL